MITINALDILKLSFSAFLYGIFFGFISELTLIFWCFVRVIFFSFKIKKHDNNANQKSVNFTKKPLLFTVTSIFMFGLGFTIMSYVIIDGSLRLYPLAISVLTYKFLDIFLLVHLRTKLIRFLFRIREVLSNHCRSLMKKAKIHIKFDKKAKTGKQMLSFPLDKI